MQSTTAPRMAAAMRKRPPTTPPMMGPMEDFFRALGDWVGRLKRRVVEAEPRVMRVAMALSVAKLRMLEGADWPS